MSAPYILFSITFMKQKNDLHFEEAIWNAEGSDIDYAELPLHRQIFISVIAIASLVVVAAFSRLLFLNLKKGEFYENRAAANFNREIILPAERGGIYDRNGRLLVRNEPVFSVFINVNEFLKKNVLDQQKLISNLQDILGDDDQVNVGGAIAQYNLEDTSVIPIERGIGTETAIAIRGLNDPVVQIQDDYRRDYVYGASLAHVLGYTGLGQADRKIEGKSGLENFYDINLRGKDGKFLEGQDAKGNRLYTRFDEEPTPGANLKITIDAELEEYFYKRMKEGLDVLGRDAGAGIILNPQTGEILSLLSFPSYDNNIFTLPGKSEERLKILRSKSLPLFNRPVSGVYNPGSTWKPVMGLAALHESLIDPTFSVYSSGVLEVANPYDASKPSKFLDWKAHGWVNLYSALARSSNIYFYVIGGGHRDYKDIKPLGVKKIEEYFKFFGFDQKTGVDLEGEAVGSLIGPDEREKKTGRIWRVGDTYNISIGQGDLAVVPLRLLSFIGAIGAGGVTKQPFLVKEIRNAAGVLLEEFHPKDILNFENMGKAISEVQKGLRAAVESKDGTAHSLSELPMTSAGKTGSAQILGNTKTNAFFVGYAPAENPEIAILVLVEDAREGSLNTIPIAKDVLKWYYENRMAAREGG